MYGFARGAVPPDLAVGGRLPPYVVGNDQEIKSLRVDDFIWHDTSDPLLSILLNHGAVT